ncbi:MAG: hypothetical protein GWN00_00455, partial [Aliifodinibius sp.]|nr:VCBS repeat-containing protein [Fodinibius sp.]NIW96975.1 hypothetical protein [Phycisphaerae bacterium]NIY23335.1 hypothetical protein [Fodinibius sp.]
MFKIMRSGLARDHLLVRILSNDISVLLGNGDGNFQDFVSYAVGAQPWFIIAGDFNRDGNADLATSNRDVHSLSVLLGNGDGTFNNPIVVSTSQDINPRIMVSGDFNEDNIPDIALVHDDYSANPQAKCGVLLGNGDGTFATISVINISVTGTSSKAIAITAGDFNNDGHLDLGAGVELTGADMIIILKGIGTGGFTQLTNFGVGSKPFALTNADLDKDNNLDLIVANSWSNRITIHMGKGDGTFSNEIPDGNLFDRQHGVYRTGDLPRWITVADLNNDQKFDLVTADELSSSVSIMIGNGDSTFVVTPRYSVGTPPQAFPMDGSAGDFDKDGDLDLAIANWGSPNDTGVVSVLLGQGDGSFLPKMDFTVGINPINGIARDFNKDGTLDLAVGNSSDSVVSVLLGRGDGSFDPAAAYSIEPNPQSLSYNPDIDVSDFDADGNWDLAVVHFNELYVAILFGNGDGTFRKPVTKITTPHSPLRIIIGDYNNDQNKDFLLQTVDLFGGSDQLYYFQGNGTGGFETPLLINIPGLEIVNTATGDFNDDDIIDLAVVDNENLSIYILFGNGDGSFSYINGVSAHEPINVLPLNLNGDPYTDLVIGSTPGSEVTLCIGNGDGTFIKLDPGYGTENGAYFMIPGDFNADSRIDMAVTGGINGESVVSVLLNTSNMTGIPSDGDPKGNMSETFVLGQNYPNPFNPRTTIPFDLPGREARYVRLSIYNILGQEIKELVNGHLLGGRYRYT